MKKYLDDSGFYVDGFASLDINKTVPVSSFKYDIGGCRIKSVLHTDSVGNTIMKKYQYADRYDSVGYFNIPQYTSKMTVNTLTFGPGCLECGNKTTISEESIAPMSGNPVEYLYVTEYTDDNGNNGTTTYSFTPNENLNPGPGPYLSPFKTNWKASLLKSKKQFRKNGSSYELVQQDTSAYEAIPLIDRKSRGIKSEYSVYCPTKGLGYRYYSSRDEIYSTEQFNTKSQSQIYYDGSGNINSTSENIFGSTKHTLPTETRTVNSSGDTLRERIKYSFDYDTTTITGNEAKAIRLLQRKNILVPIEKVSTKKVGGVEYVTQAILFTYKSDTAAMDRVFELLLAAPAAYSGFANSTITAGNLTKDSRYDESARFTLYDNYLNVLQMQASNNIIRSYLWDHNQLYPVCEVNGAAQTDIGYTSFETGNNGYWTVTGGTLDSSVALTGRRCLNPGTGNLSRANLTNGKQYIVSYWSRSGVKTISGGSGTSKTGMTSNGWTYYEHLITTSGTTLTVSGTGLMDELRLYPAGAQMNSITYTPAIGITSQCDSRNNVAYYEYDNQNRLMHVRDVKGNILKKVQYTYRANTLTP
ncbi:MAG: hypothetical protein J7578_23125 [Chitinophagaceae bacterium]|nr:hypothetical protein [Chitinophagaceae bacterium]